MKIIRLLACSLATTLTAFPQNTYPFPVSGNVGIGTTSPTTTLEVAANKSSAPLAVFRNTGDGTNNGISFLTENTGNSSVRNWALAFNSYVYGDFVIKQSNALGGDPFTAGTDRLLIDFTGNVGIGTLTPRSKLQVLGPITAGASGGSTSGIDYLYGLYGSGKLFMLGSQYSSAASFLGFAVKASPGATGYLSSTEIPVGRSAIEANGGHIAFLTGPTQTSTDGGSVNIFERVRINHNGYVGIGTAQPDDPLVVMGRIRAVGSGSSAAASVLISDTEPNGRAWQLMSGWAGNGLFSIWDTTASQNRFLIDTSGNVGIGTTSPTHKLAVNGTIKAKEVIVETTGWSDYVFADDHALQPLAEVEAHIKTNRHLPGIPSAAQVATEGISIGEMQAKLLAKIEELTLHQIAQEKEIAALRVEVRRLNAVSGTMSP